MGTVLITGATGFIGSRLSVAAEHAGYEVSRALRREKAGASGVVVGDIDAATDWSEALRGVDVVIHLAGRAHVLDETEDDPLQAFRRVNVDASRRLAEQAVQAGVRRLVFVSSIGVLGAAAGVERPFTDSTPPCPIEPYAVSKLEAETALAKVAAETGLELVVVRPPMVVGAGAPGNLAKLATIAARGYPIPVPAPPNARTLIQVENLVDFLLLCSVHPRAANRTFVVADSESVSTAEMIRYLAEGMEAKARLIPLPAKLLELCARSAGKGRLYEKVFGSLVVEAAKARDLLGWQPARSPRQGLIAAGKAFRGGQGCRGRTNPSY